MKPLSLFPPLIAQTSEGLYCQMGQFYIDPRRSVEKAIITHAHGDHAYPGSQSYLTAEAGIHVLRKRLGKKASIHTVRYGEAFSYNGVQVSLHPAGHILGSSQVRIEYRGEVWVVSGDYKLQPDPTCAPFEVVPCHTFITEATFGNPIYSWPHSEQVMQQIKTWWQENQMQNKVSLLYVYALGKSQRILASLDENMGNIFTHPSIDELNQAYEKSGVALAKTSRLHSRMLKSEFAGSLILMPPWMKERINHQRYGSITTALASGWMQLPSHRESRGVDTGFVLSDHADFLELCKAVSFSKAENVYTMHGAAKEFAAFLQTQGIQAQELPKL